MYANFAEFKFGKNNVVSRMFAEKLLEEEELNNVEFKLLPSKNTHANK